MKKTYLEKTYWHKTYWKKTYWKKNVLEKKKKKKKKTYFGLQHFIAAHALQVPQIFWSVERILVSNTTVPLMSRTTAVGT